MSRPGGDPSVPLSRPFDLRLGSRSTDPRLGALLSHRLAIRVGIALLLVAALLATLLLRASRPWFDRVYLIVLENHGASQIVGDTADAPFINRLIAGYGLATDYEAVAHPSTPDYLSLVAGSTFGIRDDQRHDIDAPSLFDQLEAHGRSWHVYAQDYPGGCFTGMSADGGPDLGPGGQYVRRHDPAASLTRITGDPRRCANITGLASFDPTAADFEMIVPNDTNNMHDGTIRQGDEWLASFVPRILAATDFAHAVLFITWDEGTTNEGGGGKVPMIVVRPGLGPGFRSPVLHTHRAFLRTIEDAWGLGCLATACQAAPMREFFGQ